MKVSVEETSSVQRKVTVEIEAAQVAGVINNLYKRLARTAKIKGFRPGKVPRSILERYYGAQVAAETAENLISDTYPKALEQEKLEPVARPDFDFDAPKADQDFVYTVILDVRPEFELKPEDYKGMELKEPDLAVSDEDLDQRIDELRDRQAVLAPLDEERPAAVGDVVVANYESFADGEPVENGAADNVEIELGSGKVQQEIEIALVKTSPGDIVEAKVDYGQDAANPAVAGKQITFKLFVKEIKKKVLPELDDDFARAVSPEFESLAGLRAKIQEEYDKAHQQQKDAALRNQIMDQVANLGEFDLPASLVKEEAAEMVESFKRRLSQSGMDPEQAGLDEEKLLEEFAPQAEKKVRAGIVLGKIADLENVDVSDADVEAEIQKTADQVNQPVGVIKDMYIKNNMMPSLRAHVLEENTLQAIKAGANITKVDPAVLAQENQADQADSQES